MGLIRAAMSAVGGTLADQWQEAFEANDMSDTTVFTTGVRVRYDDKRNRNRYGTDDLVSHGSIVHVGHGQGLLVTDGGKIVDFTMEPGYYRVDNTSQPSLFAGDFGASLRETWNRFKFGGTTPQKQKIYFINLQEIKGIKFGTSNPVNYFDEFYNAELFLRAFGSYSIKIMDPILFYVQAVPRNKDHVDINDINEQYLAEFLTALQSSINQMSVDGIRISQVASKSRELSKYMADTLDAEWLATRGFQIQAVGIQSISYDDESKEIISMRSRGAMLQDASIREGYVQGAVARGIEAAGNNKAGAGAAFMGVGMGMNAGGGFMGASSNTNFQQMQMQQQQKQLQQQQQQQAFQQPGYQVGQSNFASSSANNASHYFCTNCGHENLSGKFCEECGTARSVPQVTKCSNCGFTPTGTKPKFCPECGTAFN